MISMCMKQINLRVKLISDEDNIDTIITGYRDNNHITYKDNNVDVVLDKKKKKITMTRKCNEYTIQLNFDKDSKTISTYQVFGGNKKFELETITKELLISDNKIIINYNLEGNDFSYTLEMEEL